MKERGHSSTGLRTKYLDLRLGDCMEGMKEFPDNYFDLAIVDPPYGLGISKALNVNSKNQYLPNKEWDKQIPSRDYFDDLQRVSKNQIIWGWNYFTQMLLRCKGFIYWNKINHHPNRSEGELAFCSIEGLARHFEYMWDGNRYGKRGDIQGVGKASIRIHPTEKPVALYKWLLKNYSEPGQKILDTHLGSMSIAIACHDYKCHLTGFEIDEDYFKAGTKRVQNHVNQLQLF